jgi:hypothetical protein
LPVLTFTDSVTLHFNDEEIFIYHPEPAHTDGDSVIYFRHANVMHVGDIPASLRYPNIGVNEGGSVDGMIAAARQVMKIANRGYEDHPGPSRTDYRIQRDSATARDVCGGAGSCSDLLSKQDGPWNRSSHRSPRRTFDSGRLGGAITPDRFVTLVYTDLSRKAN